jgi:acetolactate synthase-1/2/3 large subunit
MKQEGVDTLFTLTGGHIVPILDGCVSEGIRVVDVRHEQAAGHAAEAYTRLTGRLGVAAVTAGPGVTDTITALATAQQSSTPMLLLGGRHPIRQELKGGLQEMDHPQAVAAVTNWSATAWETNRLADYIATASRHAFSGRGGPVFLDVPLDVQADMVDEDHINWPQFYRPDPIGAPVAILEKIAETLKASDKVIVFAGSGVRPRAASVLVGLADRLKAPTYLNGAARGALAFDHPMLGNRTRSAAFASAEVVLALGVDWDFRTGYGNKIGADATVVHVDADETKIGWNRSAEMGIVADPARVIEDLLYHLPDKSEASQFASDLMQQEQAAAEAAATEADVESELVQPQAFGREVASFFGPDAIVAVDGGDIVSTTARWLQISDAGHVLDPGPFGSLGTGPGYALAAKVLHPDKRVGIVFGDGGFGFNGMEYDTYVRLGLPVIGVVGNDGVWNNIKTFHRSFYPERLVATDLGRRPYHDLVSALGGYGELVTKSADIRPALERAEASGLPALINVHIEESIRMSSNYSQ